MFSFWTVLICAFAVVISVWVVFRIANRHVIKLCKAIPSAQPCFPMLGVIPSFVCSLDKMAHNLLEMVEERVFKGHRAFCLWFGPYPLIVVTDPHDIKKVLNNSLSRGKEMEESSSEYMKYGLLTAPVDHWKVTRRHLNLSFHPRNLKQLIPLFNSMSRQLVADLSRHVDGGAFDIIPHVMSTALRTICIFLYGPSTIESVNTEQFNIICHAVELAAQMTALRLCRPWLHIPFLFKLLYAKEITSINAGVRLTFEMVKSSSDSEGADLRSRNNKTRFNFKTIIRSMHELQERISTFTDDFIVDEVSSFLATGTDTIGATVSSCLLVLARFPDIQDKVYEEICSLVSKNDEDDVTSENLKQLNYLEQVIKETLRFFTPVPFSSRAPTKDIDLGGYTIPANKLTALCIRAACFNPKCFPDPYMFDPDRFSTPTSLDDFFMPFGRGPRNCIGKEYSMMLVKVMVAHVIRRYRLSTDCLDIKGLRKRFMVTLTLYDGYNVCLSNR